MWWLIPGLIAAFLAVLIIRAALFVPPPKRTPAGEDETFDGDHAVVSLQRMVQCKTISNDDHSQEDSAEFEKFRAVLMERYPLLHAACPPERIGRRGILFRWKGRSDAAPTILMAHYDVVPAEESAWQKMPFAGIRENGELWGRGTLDTKCTLCAALEAAETLLAVGFMPENDIYFAFAGDEEVAGTDAPAIVEELHRRNVTAALVVDEGGAVVEGVFPGVKDPCALIGTAEKGMLNVQFKVTSSGGHASAPPPHTPVGVLAQAVGRVEDHPFPQRLAPPTLELFDTLGRYAPFGLKLVFANLWCFKGLLGRIAGAKMPELNALMRTTCAFTMMQGSLAPNVLPPSASVVANLRLLGNTPESAVDYLRSVVQDDSIELISLYGNPPSPYSRTDSEGWARLTAAVSETWPQAIVSPYLMIAASDSRHYSRISESVFRFSAMELSSDDRKRIHGNDERIREEKLHDAVRFYLRLIKKS